MPRNPAQLVHGNPEWNCCQCCLVGACLMEPRASGHRAKKAGQMGTMARQVRGRLSGGGRLEAGEFWQ